MRHNEAADMADWGFVGLSSREKERLDWADKTGTVKVGSWNLKAAAQIGKEGRYLWRLLDSYGNHMDYLWTLTPEPPTEDVVENAVDDFYENCE